MKIDEVISHTTQKVTSEGFNQSSLFLAKTVVAACKTGKKFFLAKEQDKVKGMCKTYKRN